MSWWRRNHEFVGIILISVIALIVCCLAWVSLDAAEAMFR